MENPGSWGEAERTVNEALKQHQAQVDLRLCGASLEMVICNALRAKGLLQEYSSVPNPNQ